MPTNHTGRPYSVEDSCAIAHDDAVFLIARARVLSFLFFCHTATLEEIINETKISLNSLARVFISLIDEGVLERTENGISITSDGMRWVIRNRRHIFMQRHKVIYEEPLTIRGIVDAIKSTKKLPKGYSF